MAAPVVHTLSAAGQTPAWRSGGGRFNLSIYGTFTGLYATVERRSPGTGTNDWVPCTAQGAPVVFYDVASEVLDEVEADTDYRVNIAAITSGTANVRFGQ